MKINYIQEMPVTSNYWVAGDLEEWEIEKLNKLGLDEIWYWYGVGDYEGAGQLLMRKGEKYDLHDMGHCSCYGPVEEVVFHPQKLKDLKSVCSEDYATECKPLFQAAMKRLPA